MLFVEVPSIKALIIVKSDETKVAYALCENKEKVNEQQFNLPEGTNITYSDGAKFINCGDYARLRNWPLPDGRVVDRVALRWKNLYL